MEIDKTVVEEWYDTLIAEGELTFFDKNNFLWFVEWCVDNRDIAFEFSTVGIRYCININYQ